jgi:hypothetical protein
MDFSRTAACLLLLRPHIAIKAKIQLDSTRIKEKKFETLMGNHPRMTFVNSGACGMANICRKSFQPQHCNILPPAIPHGRAA